MTISRGDRYYCSARREKSTCNADRGIGVHELEHRVLNGLKDILQGNESLIDEFAAEFKRELSRLQKEGHGAKRRLVKELTAILAPYAISCGVWRPASTRSMLS